jgi:hypothetical protein
MGVSSCCSRNETSGNIKECIESDKLNGYNTHQKLIELKAYRFFINNLYNLMMINNGIEK